MSICAKAERVLLFAGLAMMGICAVAYIGGRLGAQLAVAQFKRELLQVDTAALQHEHWKVDKTLWSDKRVRDHEASLAMRVVGPLALLRIPRLRLEVPVFDGTDDVILNRGVGRIVGTALPGEIGNIAIAGHRDGFFRSLKDIAATDTVELVTKAGTDTYVVDSVQIVTPENVNVLTTGENPSVTLVTCYPFYFIGGAPNRFIVHATLQSSNNRRADRSVRVSSAGTNVKSQENRK